MRRLADDCDHTAASSRSLEVRPPAYRSHFGAWLAEQMITWLLAM